MKDRTFYFITGSQHLYGPEALEKVLKNSQKIVDFIQGQKDNPATIIFSDVVKSSEEIDQTIQAINKDDDCAGIIVWMHTFSPAKMWIEGLTKLHKPLLHLHTQANQKIPFETIDMDFMNLNQSAHGDRELGFLTARMHLRHKVITGFYQSKRTLDEIFVWMRAALGYHFSRQIKVVRFGDNMRQVAVTEGDKVEAQIKLGWQVNGYGIGDFVDYVKNVKDTDVDLLVKAYHDTYRVITEDIASIKIQAKYELAFEKFLADHQAQALTTTFEDLHGLEQLPGLSIQRLMSKGYGFGGEGDWKVSALTALLKYMGQGLTGGASFMEDYTYHFDENGTYVLGSHMLEICPSIAQGDVLLDVQRLDIGGKKPPARLKFKGRPGVGYLVTLIDMGDRFRMVVNHVDIIPGVDMPKLPVAQVLWVPRPNLEAAATAWIYAGGAHHSVLTTQLSEKHLRDFADIAGLEYILIDEETKLDAFKQQLEFSDVMYKLKSIR